MYLNKYTVFKLDCCFTIVGRRVDKVTNSVLCLKWDNTLVAEASADSDNLSLSRYLSFSVLDNRHLSDIWVICLKCHYDKVPKVMTRMTTMTMTMTCCQAQIGALLMFSSGDGQEARMQPMMWPWSIHSRNWQEREPLPSLVTLLMSPTSGKWMGLLRTAGLRVLCSCPWLQKLLGVGMRWQSCRWKNWHQLWPDTMAKRKERWQATSGQDLVCCCRGEMLCWWPTESPASLPLQQMGGFRGQLPPVCTSFSFFLA